MKASRGEIEPIYVLGEFKCDAIPGVAVFAAVPKTNPKRRKNTAKAPKANGKRTNESTVKPKSQRKKGPAA